MLQELTFVDSVLLITVFDSAAVRGKFSCKIKYTYNKFTARGGPPHGALNPCARKLSDFTIGFPNEI